MRVSIVTIVEFFIIKTKNTAANVKKFLTSVSTVLNVIKPTGMELNIAANVEKVLTVQTVNLISFPEIIALNATKIILNIISIAVIVKNLIKSIWDTVNFVTPNSNLFSSMRIISRVKQYAVVEQILESTVISTVRNVINI